MAHSDEKQHCVFLTFIQNLHRYRKVKSADERLVTFLE